MFVYMRLLTEEVAVCKNVCSEYMRQRRNEIMDFTACPLQQKTDLIHAPTFTWPRYMFIRHETSIHSWPTMRWQSSESRSLRWHKHSSSIVIIIATVTANLSQAVLTLVPELVEETIQQQGNLTNSINSVAARQPIKDTESVSPPLPILGQ